MVLTLYGYPRSTYTQRAAMTLREKGVPYKFAFVDLLKGEQKAPAYLEKQPFGQAPYIDDDGFILYESRAIARYIAEKYADQGTPGLIPTDLKAKALFEQAFSIESFNYNPTASKAVYEKVFKQEVTGVPTDEELFESLLTELGKKLDVYDQILSKQKYLAGDEVTLADLWHLPYAELLEQTGVKAFEERPNVSRWLNELKARPSWQALKGGVLSGTA